MHDKEKANEYGIDKIPAIVLVGKKDYGVRFYGTPSGYEFMTLVQDMIAISKGETTLNEGTKKEIRSINTPLHIQVFVTPTCPYCPNMVHLAHQAAIENDNIKADMVEIAEFPHLAHKYGVMGVPKTVINENIELAGSVTEETFIEKMSQVQK